MYVKFIDSEIYGQITRTYDDLISGEIKYCVRIVHPYERTHSLKEIYDDMIEHLTDEEYMVLKIING